MIDDKPTSTARLHKLHRCAAERDHGQAGRPRERGAPGLCRHDQDSRNAAPTGLPGGYRDMQRSELH